MATNQSTPIPADSTAERLNTIRVRYGIAGRIAVHPKYQYLAVTDNGRVFSWRVSTRNRRGQIRELKRAQVNNKRIKSGPRHIYVRFDGLRSALVHRLVAEAFLPAPEEGQGIVRHLDGNPANNCPENLAWGTQTDNMRDMIRHGRSLKGERNPQAKLTAKRVELIRAILAEGFRADMVGNLFGTSEANVNRIRNGESWTETEAT